MKEYKKISYNEFYEDDFDLYKNLSDRVKTFLIGDCCDYQIQLEESIIECESPIEQLLSLELNKILITQINEYNPYIDVLSIEKQFEIGKYRVDFMLPVKYKNQGIVKFIIECDGYEFYQKTKKQVENDNIRHRFFQKENYEIIRFSGTEIYHNPHNCAKEVKDIILSKCEYIKGDK